MCTMSTRGMWTWYEAVYFIIVAVLMIILPIGNLASFESYNQKNPLGQKLYGFEIDGILERAKQLLAIYWLLLVPLAWKMAYLLLKAVYKVFRREKTGTIEAEQDARKAVKRCVKWGQVCLIVFGIEMLWNYLLGYYFSFVISLLFMANFAVIVEISLDGKKPNVEERGQGESMKEIEV